MSSWEDRIGAVELYIKLGKRVSATILQLGYPTKNALKGWHREYEKRLDLPVGFAVRGPKFSQAQKQAAVEHYLTQDRCISATIESVGLSRLWNVDRMGSRGACSGQEAIIGVAVRPSYPDALKQAGAIGLCSRQESAQAGDLAAYPWIAPLPGSPLMSDLLMSVINFLAKSEALAVPPFSVVFALRKDNRTTALPFAIPQPGRSLGILRRLDSPRAPAAKRFVQHVITVFDVLKHTIQRHENAVTWS